MGLGTKKVLSPYFSSFSVPANSDYLPFVSLQAERSNFLNRNAYSLLKVQASLKFSAFLRPESESLRRNPRWLPLVSSKAYWGAAGLLGPYRDAYEALVTTLEKPPAPKSPSTPAAAQETRLSEIRCEPSKNGGAEKWMRHSLRTPKTHHLFHQPRGAKISPWLYEIS